MSNNKKRRGFRPVLWLNYFFVIVLLMANLSPLIAPDVFWPMSIVGLAFPVILIFNLVFVFYWAFLKRKYFFYSLVAVLLSYSLIFDHFQWIRPEKQNLENEDAFKIISFNARNLSNTNYKSGNKVIRDSIMSYLSEYKADLICFQEFQSYPTRGVISEKDFQKNLGLIHYKMFPYFINSNTEFKDLMISFSKYPIINSEAFYDKGKCYGFFTDLEIKQDTIRLFNIHLESNHFSRDDYEIFNENEVILNESKRNQIQRLLQKIKRYGKRRSIQSRVIRLEIEKSPYPVIVAGDFNDTPASFSSRHIRGQLTDAFRHKGSGYGNTYNGRLPPMRIDYLLFDPKIHVMYYRELKVNLSDHFPVLAVFKL
jgi:endonuclease/exonuclease/phosphatase family metal-dependent hydrolase